MLSNKISNLNEMMRVADLVRRLGMPQRQPVEATRREEGSG